MVGLWTQFTVWFIGSSTTCAAERTRKHLPTFTVEFLWDLKSPVTAAHYNSSPAAAACKSIVSERWSCCSRDESETSSDNNDCSHPTKQIWSAVQSLNVDGWADLNCFNLQQSIMVYKIISCICYSVKMLTLLLYANAAVNVNITEWKWLWLKCRNYSFNANITSLC